MKTIGAKFHLEQGSRRYMVNWRPNDGGDPKYRWRVEIDCPGGVDLQTLTSRNPSRTSSVALVRRAKKQGSTI